MPIDVRILRDGRMSISTSTHESALIRTLRQELHHARPLYDEGYQDTYRRGQLHGINLCIRECERCGCDGKISRNRLTMIREQLNRRLPNDSEQKQFVLGMRRGIDRCIGYFSYMD